MWSKELSALLDNYYLPEPGKPYIDRIPDEVLDHVYADRLFRCFLPEELDGLMGSAAQTFEVLRKISFYNGSLGWLVQIGNGGNYFVSCFEPEFARQWLGTRNDVIAGSGHPSGSAEKTGEGYRISGTWPHCSGADHTNWFTVTFIDSDSGLKKAALIPRKEVEVLPDWNAIGLRHSSTHSIRLQDCLVPEERVFDVSVQKWIPDHPLFRVPFVIYAQLFFLQVAAGVLQRMTREAALIREINALHWKEQDPQRFDRLSEVIFRSEEIIQTLVRRSEGIVSDAENGADESSQRQELLFLAGKVRQTGHELFHELGITVVSEEHPVSVFTGI